MEAPVDNDFILTPYFLDQPVPGLEPLAQPGWRMNKRHLPEGNLQHRMCALHQPIADFVARSIERGHRPVSIAGDCCAAIGVAAGLQRAGLDPVLVWLDAHGDFNTWETTHSNFLGGMPLAMLVGRGELTMVNAAGAHPLREDRVILSDARDLDAEEKQALAGSRVSHLADIHALLQHPLLSNALYIHIDTDIINPKDAPAMNYPAAGGPSAAELKAILRSVAQTTKSVAVSLSSWNPDMDKDGRSRTACMEVLHSLIGDA